MKNNNITILQEDNIPAHVAIIMDGNGRWAKERGLVRTDGHEKGLDAIQRVTLAANNFGVKVLTLYAFSTENWNRPILEVQHLMEMPSRFFTKFVPILIENNVKLLVTVFEQRVPDLTRRALKRAVEDTEHCTGMILNFAFNYGGRAEITEVTRTIAKKVTEGELKLSKIDENTIASHLLTVSLDDYQNVDLLIRTSGEQRLSNFLLWQNAYSEIFFMSEYWPDFNEELLKSALFEYQSRDRRYGGLNNS